MENSSVDIKSQRAAGKFLERVSRLVLKPIIGMLLRAGLPYSAFAEIARSMYVEVASEQFGIRGRRTNRSRIAMLTGLSRAQVRRELDGNPEDSDRDGNESRDKVRHVSRVLLGWHTDPEFLDATGEPLLLTVDTGPRSFKSLYEKYSGKVVPPTTMLKELKQVGAVQLVDGDKLQVRTRAYTPEQADPEALKRVCMAVRDLANAGSYNLYRGPGQPPQFERFATNQLIPASAVNDFHDLLDRRGQEFLEEIDNWLTERERSADATDLVRIGVGVYQISPAHISRIARDKNGKTKN